MKTKITAVLFFFFITQTFYAQPKMNISIGGGYTTLINFSKKLKYWDKGYSVNLSLEYFLKEKTSLLVEAYYQKYFYNKKLLQLVVPDVVGYKYTVKGENSSIYNLVVAGRVYTSTYFIRSFLTVGLGGMFINQGNVIKREWMEGSKNYNLFSLNGSNRNYFLWQFILGSGIEISFYNNLKILFEANIAGGFDNLFYFPVTASIKFGNLFK